MKIGILGTGMVGEAIGLALIQKGHELMIGSRTANSEKALAFVEKAGSNAYAGDFEQAANFGELLFICLNGQFAIDVLKTIHHEAVDNKIVVDVTNPLDFSVGLPPQILEAYRIVSLSEHIQQVFPGAFIVKTLNTVNYKLMIDAREVAGGDHNMFICGNDIEAKARVKSFLTDNFYWQNKNLVDLGDLKGARAMEAIVPFWVLVYRTAGTPLFNFKMVQ
jgi:predicted dinucleotide-binding enzyme